MGCSGLKFQLQLSKALNALEHIDDDCDEIGISFVEVDKVDIARHHGVEDFPTLVFYKSEIPAVYEGTVQLGFAIPHENEFLHKMEKKCVLQGLRTRSAPNKTLIRSSKMHF